MEDYTGPISYILLLASIYSLTEDSVVTTEFVIVLSVSSGSAGKREERMLPVIQPIAPRPIIVANHVSKTVLYATLKTAASTPARAMPSVRPAVTPIRHPGWARLRPRNLFIIAVKYTLISFFCYITDDNVQLQSRQDSNIYTTTCKEKRLFCAKLE